MINSSEEVIIGGVVVVGGLGIAELEATDGRLVEETMEEVLEGRLDGAAVEGTALEGLLDELLLIDELVEALLVELERESLLEDGVVFSSLDGVVIGLLAEELILTVDEDGVEDFVEGVVMGLEADLLVEEVDLLVDELTDLVVKGLVLLGLEVVEDTLTLVGLAVVEEALVVVGLTVDETLTLVGFLVDAGAEAFTLVGFLVEDEDFFVVGWGKLSVTVVGFLTVELGFLDVLVDFLVLLGFLDVLVDFLVLLGFLEVVTRLVEVALAARCGLAMGFLVGLTAAPRNTIGA